MTVNEELKLKDKERLLELFDATLSLFNENHDLVNNFLTGELNLSSFERKSILIGALLDKKENFNLKTKLDILLYSHGLKENYYYNPLLKIFKEIHKERFDSENLFNVFFEKLENYLKSIKDITIYEYILVFPINIDFKSGIPIRFLKKNMDIDIKLVPYSIYNKDYLGPIIEYLHTKYGDRRELIPEYNQELYKLIEKYNHRDNQFFIAKVFARNILFSVKKVSRNIDINIGLYNLLLYYQMDVISFGGDPFEKSIGAINNPIVYVFNNEECKAIMFSTYEKPKRNEKIDFNILNSIVELINYIQKFKSGKLKTLLYDAFINYYAAIRTSEYSVSFLIFWNIIERLFLKKSGTKLMEIINRLKAIYPDSIKEKKDIEERIDMLYKKRNLFVHEAIDKITRHDRSFAKSLVEHLIMSFINFAIEIEDIGMLEFFYQNLRKSSNVLQREAHILKLLEDIKSKDTE